MSILLEALRKSEKSQRPVAAPTIHSDEPGSLAGEPMRALPVALLIVAALLITAWLAWRQYQPVSDVYQPPVTLPASKSTAEPPAKSVAESVPEPQGKAVQKSAETQTTVSKQTSDSSKSVVKKAADGSSAGKRTPVESYTPEDPVKKGPDADAKIQTGQAQAGQTKSGNKDRKPVAAKKSTKKSADETTAPEEYQSPEPDPISYWELPDAVREQVPEIKFSVLVFADIPADRFVLMNGQRLGEGDSYQEGLVVKEIRRDGVVFSYRLYQFLVRR